MTSVHSTMPRRPNNKIKKRLEILRAADAAPVAEVAVKYSVSCVSIYRWRKKRGELAVLASKEGGKANQFYGDLKPFCDAKILFPDLEKCLVDWIAEMRKGKSRCVTVKCLIVIIAKFDAAFAVARNYTALRQWVMRFLKRNHLSVRRITHNGTKRRIDMQDVADSFALSMNLAVEMDGILSQCDSPMERYSGLFNMDQTGVFIDSPGRLTIDYVGARSVDVVQGTSVNGARCSVFLCASATGHKLPAFIVFGGKPGCAVEAEVTQPTFGYPGNVHTVQVNAYCDHSIMQQWINEIWAPTTSRCRMLLLDSLKVHKMPTVRETLQELHTQVEYIPPGVTGLCQPMDVSVMKAFKNNLRDLYVAYHIDEPFCKTAGDRRAMLSQLVGTAWDMVKPSTIVNGFRRAHLLPIGPRDQFGKFATGPPAVPGVAVVDAYCDSE